MPFNNVVPPWMIGGALQLPDPCQEPGCGHMHQPDNPCHSPGCPCGSAFLAGEVPEHLVTGGPYDPTSPDYDTCATCKYPRIDHEPDATPLMACNQFAPQET